MNTELNTTAPATLSAAEAAKMLGISLSHFYNLNKDGKLGPEAVKLGHSVRWRRAELADWLEAGCPDRETWLANREGSK